MAAASTPAAIGGRGCFCTSTQSSACTSAIAATRQPIRDARGEGAIVFDAARWPQATAAALDPEGWQPAVTPVSAGGRGAPG